MEGDAGTSPGVFRVSLSAASAGPVTVSYETWDGSATGPSDFDAAPAGATVTLPAGATTAEIRVLVHGDTVREGNEVFFVHLASAIGATVSSTGHHGTGTIVDDDGAAPSAGSRPPNTIVHGGPSRTTRSRSASFHIVSTEPGSRFQCKLDRRAWRFCRASVTYRNLARGLHTFRARAIDSDGNVDPTPARRTWRIR